jgi:hypothetical protein
MFQPLYHSTQNLIARRMSLLYVGWSLKAWVGRRFQNFTFSKSQCKNSEKLGKSFFLVQLVINFRPSPSYVDPPYFWRMKTICWLRRTCAWNFPKKIWRLRDFSGDRRIFGDFRARLVRRRISRSTWWYRSRFDTISFDPRFELDQPFFENFPFLWA